MYLQDFTTTLEDAHLQPRMVLKPPFTLPVPGVAPVEGETIPRRHPKAVNGLFTTPEEGCNTLYDILLAAARKFGDAKAIGSRPIIDIHVETKKVKKVINGKTEFVPKEWKYFELGPYQYMSYNEFLKMAHELGAGFRKLGLTKEDRVHIYANTSAHWLAISHGACSQSMTTATAYDSLGEEGLKASLQATKAKLMFLDSPLLKGIHRPLQNLKDLKFVVYDVSNEESEKDVAKLRESMPHLQFVSFEELRILGMENPVDPVPPDKEDLSCIMYTSGSTGAPKGVLIRHKAIVAALVGGTEMVHHAFGPKDAFLAFLPAAHIIEYALENACLLWGVPIGYGNPKTLTDASVRNCNGDLREFRPTIFAGVPAIWENVRKGVETKVAAGGPILSTVFWAALSIKSFLMYRGLPGVGLLDKLIFAKVRDATGGRVRLCLSGGGPIARETQNFISMVVAVCINGYGLTETTSLTALCDPLCWTLDAIGGLSPTVEVKLVDFADAGYYAKNNQGEVWIRGTSVFQAYFDNEAETEEALTKDGWFRSGDIGEWDENYHLRIIDRKKNLVKTLNGEYIAIEKLEAMYRSTAIVANICVYAAPDKTKPIAIIVPAEPALNALAKSNNIEGEGMHLAHDSKIQQLVLKELQTKGREAGLTGIEIIESVVITDEEWTPQNGFVTPAQKLNRKAILKEYQAQIDKAYKNNS